MKYLFALLLITFISLSLTFSESDIPNNGLIAYYSFNNCDARDETENGSDGRLYGNVDCNCGIEGNGLVFDGKQSYIEFEGAVNNYFNTSDFTISFYFKTSHNTIFKESLLSKRDTCNENHMFDIQLNQQLGIVDTDVHESDWKDYPHISPMIEDSGWYHFALVRHGVTAYTYINGELRQQGRRCSGVDIGNEALLSFSNTICVQTGSVRRFKGVLDELRIYDKALSKQDILNLYSRYPIESAETNCVTFVPDFPKKTPQDLLNTRESTYICAVD